MNEKTMEKNGWLKVVGMGPGAVEDMTLRAFHALKEAQLVVGYTVYNDLLKEHFPDKEYYATPMRRETERCRYALQQAADGARTVLVCSGDSSVYGMASLVLELAEQQEQAGQPCPEIEIIPGITAALSGGAMLGSPLTCDFAVVSLSDLLTPWPVIGQRLRGAAAGDFVIAIYNPASKKRQDHLRRACDILLAHRPAETLCGVVRNIRREGQQAELMTLGELKHYSADMFTTVFVGNSRTRRIAGRMVVPRGYLEKNGMEQSRGPAREASENEPAHLADQKEKILIFGGTTEGRILAGRLAARGMEVTLCVATDYGEEVVPPAPGLQVRSGGLSEEAILALMKELQPRFVFDATHPYASEITRKVLSAAAAAALSYQRIRRGGVGELLSLPEEWSPEEKKNSLENDLIFADSIEAAARLLNESTRRAFISTGSRGAYVWGQVKDAQTRLTLRILPSEDAVRMCREAGFSGENLICMQGPFSEALNEVMFREARAEILVTKASGKTGGFPQKLAAARRLGMKVLVIVPPEDVPGISMAQAEELCAF